SSGPTGSCREESASAPAAGSPPKVGLEGGGASSLASSATSAIGLQSASPARQQRESGPISPPSQRSFTFSSASGPTCSSWTATYHSWSAAEPLGPASPSVESSASF